MFKLNSVLAYRIFNVALKIEKYAKNNKKPTNEELTLQIKLQKKIDFFIADVIYDLNEAEKNQKRS